MRAWQRVDTVDQDGVRLAHADDGAGLITAGLIFRVGWADEPLPARGVTHLVEHLAHVAVPDRSLRHNASVGPTETEFWVRGRPDEVTAHLNAVVRGLADPDVTDLPRELGVLRAEGTGSGFPLIERRFSNRGYGAGGWAQFGLEREDPDQVRRWATERFTRSAAVGWRTGETPGLDLRPLPAGDGVRWPPVERPPGWALRRHVIWEDTAVGWSGEVRSGWAGALATELLEERATARLRHELGTTYSVSIGSMSIGPGDRVRFLVADRDRSASAVVVRDVLLEGLDLLAREAPGDAELERLRQARVRELEDHGAAASIASLAASALLDGREARGAEELEAVWEAITGEEVRHAAWQLRESMLLAVPSEARPDPRELPSLDRGSDEPYDGDLHVCARRRASKLADPVTESSELRIAPAHGVSSTRGGHTIAVPFEDATLAVVTDGIEVHVFDASDRCVSACVHDDEDRRRWLEPIERALGPDRVVHLDRGRPRALARIAELAESHLGSRARVSGFAYPATHELRPHEEVVGIAAARHEGLEGLVVVTADRLVFHCGRDTWWIDLHGVDEVESSEGLRGGQVTFVSPRSRIVLDRVRAKGRATAIAEQVRGVAGRRDPAAMVEDA